MSTVILAAGVGKRMYSKTPKILHKVLGKPIIQFVIDLAREIESQEIILVIGNNAEQIKKTFGHEITYATQRSPLGSGDAAKEGIKVAATKNVLILCGDVPLLRKETIYNFLDYHTQNNANLTILTCEVINPFGYGRIIRNEDNNVIGIVEQADATIEEQKITEINAGAYFGKRDLFLSSLNEITSENRLGEYYLTDIVDKVTRDKGKVFGFKIENEQEIIGVNSKLELTMVREIVKARWFEQLMLRGVYIEDPKTTNIDLSVQIGNFVHIRPYTLIEGNTKISDGETIGPYAFIKDGKKLK